MSNHIMKHKCMELQKRNETYDSTWYISLNDDQWYLWGGYGTVYVSISNIVACPFCGQELK